MLAVSMKNFMGPPVVAVGRLVLRSRDVVGVGRGGDRRRLPFFLALGGAMAATTWS
jgi:hypothetical protein